MTTSEWGVPTPSGHIYHLPTTPLAAHSRCLDHAQGIIEHWDEAERCPTPTWDVVGCLLDEIGRRERVVRSVIDEFLASESYSTISLHDGLNLVLEETLERFHQDDDGGGND